MHPQWHCFTDRTDSMNAMILALSVGCKDILGISNIKTEHFDMKLVVYFTINHCIWYAWYYRCVFKKKKLISALFCLRSCNYDKTCVKPDYTTAHFLPQLPIFCPHEVSGQNIWGLTWRPTPPNRAQSQPNDRGVQKARISVCPPPAQELPRPYQTNIPIWRGGVGWVNMNKAFDFSTLSLLGKLFTTKR